jgi:hypothetical protein
MGDCNIYVNCDNKNEHIESLIKRVIAERDDGTLAVRTCCVEGACTPYVECDKRESVESLFKKLIVENDDGSLAVRVNCCSSTPVPPVLGALELTFDDICNAALLIGDYTSVDAPAPGNITVTPDAVGDNPVTWYYTVCYLDAGITERSLFSIESSFIIGDATNSYVFNCNTIPSWGQTVYITMGIISEIYTYARVSTLPIEMFGEVAPCIDIEACYSDILALPVHQNLTCGDATDVSDWNTFFGFDTDPTLYTTQFTSVTVVGNVVKLYGGSGITLRGGLFSEGAYYESIIKVEDNAGCLVASETIDETIGDVEYQKTPFYYYSYDNVTEEEIEKSCTNLTTFISTSFTAAVDNCFSGCTGLISPDFSALTTCGNSAFASCTGLISPDFSALTTCGNNAFASCTGLISPDFSALTTCGNNAFASCTGLISPDFSALTTVGDGAFSGCTSFTTINLSSCTSLGTTTGDDNVFSGITNNTITLTVPTALMNAQGPGIPDGDIQYLVDPLQGNTVTIIQV